MRQFTIPVIPGIAAVVVPTLAALLLVVGARSPNTHANFLPQADPGYTRTAQSIVGQPVRYIGPGLASAPLAMAGPVAAGRALLVSHTCAACHGVEGRGGVVGPPIVGFDVDDLQAKTRKGPGGMPAFAPEALSEDDLTAISAYLQSLAK